MWHPKEINKGKEEEKELVDFKLENIKAAISELFKSVNKQILNANQLMKKENTLSQFFFQSESIHTSSLQMVNSYLALLTVTHKLEKQLYAHINAILKRYNAIDSLKESNEMMAIFKSYLLCLYEVNRRLFQVMPDILEELSFSLPSIQEKLLKIQQAIQLPKWSITEISVFIPGKADNEQQNKILEEINKLLKVLKDILMLSFIKVAIEEPGKHLITKLEKSLTENNHIIELSFNYAQDPSSLVALSKNPNAMAENSLKANNEKNIQNRSKAIIKGSGSSSTFSFPIWPEDSENYTTKGAVNFLDTEIVKFFIQNYLAGSLSYDKNKKMFYTPFHVEVLHELIHVLHNSRGTNRANINVLEKTEIDIWKDAEEYWTIEGGKLSENLFNKNIAAPDRFGHEGASLAFVLAHKKVKNDLESKDSAQQNDQLKPKI